jgi:hypothetical protein
MSDPVDLHRFASFSTALDWLDMWFPEENRIEKSFYYLSPSLTSSSSQGVKRISLEDITSYQVHPLTRGVDVTSEFEISFIDKGLKIIMGSPLSSYEKAVNFKGGEYRFVDVIQKILEMVREIEKSKLEQQDLFSRSGDGIF